MARLHVLEEGPEEYSGRKKKPEWRRTSTDEKYRGVERILGEGEIAEAPSAKVLHIGERLPGKEIKLPEHFFEKTLSTAIRNTYGGIKEGLSLVKVLNSENKDLESVKDEDESKINLKLLEEVKLIDPGDENLLTEIKRLNDYKAQEYDLANLRGKIDSHPQIIALKNSDLLENEKQREYRKLAGEIMGHEVREIFRQDKITGQAVRVAVHVRAVVREGLMKIVDRKEENANGSTPPENVLIEPEAEIDGENREKKLAELENRIQSEEFNDDERGYIDRTIKDYTKDVYEAKKNIEDGGGVVGDKWIDVFRTSHIEKCKTWGLKRQLAPEKAELLGKYLELKLPHGLPPEKPVEDPEIVESGSKEETKKELYSKEQVEELSDLVKVAREYMEQIERSELEKIIGQLILEESVSEGVFTEEQIPNVVQWVMEWVDIFSIKK